MKKLNVVQILALVPAALVVVAWVETLLNAAAWDIVNSVSLGLSTITSAVSVFAAFKNKQRLAWISFLILSFVFYDNLGGTIAFAGFVFALMNDMKTWKPGRAEALIRFIPWGLAIGGFLLIIGPFTISLIFAPIFCGANANEGSCALSALPWMTFVTAPLGFLLIVVGAPLSAWLLSKRSK